MDISTSSSLTKLTDFVEAFELFKDKESHRLAYKKRLTDSHYSPLMWHTGLHKITYWPLDCVCHQSVFNVCTTEVTCTGS